MNNARVSAVFDEIADYLEVQGANSFRVRAYRNVARTIKDLPEPLAAIAADPNRKLTDLPGVGDDLAAKITTLLATGELPQHQELKSQVPDGVLAMLRIPGMGPKKAAALHKELGLKTLEDLKLACEQHRVRELKGFGAKTEETILAGLAIAEQAQARMYWADADKHVESLREHLSRCPEIEQLEFAGSYRRGKETVGDLDILVVAKNHLPVMDCLGAYPDIAEVIARGDTKMSCRLQRGLQVDLRVVPAKSFGAALQYFTGSKDHNVRIRGRAKDAGLKINEYGVFRGEEYIAGQQEQDVYATLGLPWIPPELREARQELDWADAGALPDLITEDDLRGDLHMHTTETDGTASLEEMVAAAKARGHAYIAITDHSKRVTMARGLNEERLLAQWEAIDRLNAQEPGIRVLKGIEVDILEKGGLDLPDAVLAHADWVVASLHYGQNQPRAKITARIVDALANPVVTAIAHPTGRLINRREPYEVDLDAVYAAAKKHRKLLELNANPARLDLDDVHCAAAKANGILIVISSDAHSTDGLNVLRYGIMQARRAGLTKQDVANTRTLAQFLKLVGKEG